MVPAATTSPRRLLGSTYKADQDIGPIEDIAFDADGVKAYIVGVDGFPGLGDHYVAVRPSALNVTHNASDDDKK